MELYLSCKMYLQQVADESFVSVDIVTYRNSGRALLYYSITEEKCGEFCVGWVRL
jgi:hypothetical protein